MDRLGAAGIYTHIADTLMVHVHMEYISKFGNITRTGWLYDPSEKISALLQKTFPMWSDCRLAYGVQFQESGPILKLKSATPISATYAPSAQEFFKDTHLTSGDNYYLLISQLHIGLRDFSIRDNPHIAENIRSAVLKYSALFPVVKTHLIPPDPRNRPGPSAKRPVDTHPHGGPAHGGSRAKTTRDSNALDSNKSLASMSSLLDLLEQ